MTAPAGPARAAGPASAGAAPGRTSVLVVEDRGPGGARLSVPGGAARWLLVGAALAGGLLLALLTIHLAGPWDARFTFR